jgi:hypothetical protein
MIRAALLADADAIFGIASIQASQYDQLGKALRLGNYRFAGSTMRSIDRAYERELVGATTKLSDRVMGVRFTRRRSAFVESI